MRFPVDLSLFDQTSHTPSLFRLEQSMGGGMYGQIRDYCIPVNSYFPTLAMFEAWQQVFARTLRYYPADNEQIAATAANCFGLDPDSLVMFNGATELLTWVDQLLLRGTIVIPVPTFGQWTDRPRQTKKRVMFYERKAESDFELDVADLLQLVRRHNAQVLVLCNPNNPTGAYICKRDMLGILDALADLALIVVDESFIDFSDRDRFPSVAADAVNRRNVIVAKSLGKNLGMHGMRLGYSVSNPTMARLLRTHVPFWNINAVAEMVLQTLADYLPEYEASRRAMIQDRYSLERLLQNVPGLAVFPSQANYVFCRVADCVDGAALRNDLLTEYGFLVRHCGNKVGSDSQHFRVVARPESESRELIDAIKAMLSRQRVPSRVPIS